jgi:ElaB/YqjD/DUF883 family membrane-anchored ribosome-binding protein
MDMIEVEVPNVTTDGHEAADAAADAVQDMADAAEDVTDGTAGKAAGATQRAREVVADVTEAARSTVETAAPAVRDAAEAARSAVQTAAPAVLGAGRATAGTAYRQVSRAPDEQLALGTAFAAGLVAGFLLARVPRPLLLLALVPLVVFGGTLLGRRSPFAGRTTRSED